MVLLNVAFRVKCPFNSRRYSFNSRKFPLKSESSKPHINQRCNVPRRNICIRKEYPYYIKRSDMTSGKIKADRSIISPLDTQVNRPSYYVLADPKISHLQPISNYSSYPSTWQNIRGLHGVYYVLSKACIVFPWVAYRTENLTGGKQAQVVGKVTPGATVQTSKSLIHRVDP